MKSHWEQIKLADLFELQMGKTPAREKDQYWKNGDNKWVSIADIGKFLRYTDETKEKITDIAISESGIKQVPKNTLIMSFKLSLGKVAITSEPIYTNEAIMAFIDRKKRPLSLSFLFHLFKNKDWSAGTNKAVLGMTLNKATLKEISIPVPPLLEQEEIAQKLDAVCRLITLRKQQLQKLNQLASSRFIEMFVTSDEKEFSWNIQPLQLLADVVSGITKGRKTKCQNLISVPYMAVSNVKDGYINWSNLKTIDATQEEIKQYQLFPGDVLMTEGGDPDKVGRGAILNSVPQNCIHQNHIFRVRLHQDMVEPVFFAGYLQQKSVKQYFLKCAKQTTGIASINMTQLRSLPVILPPLELQNEFVAFIEQLDKSKVIGEKQRFILEKITCIYILW